MNLTRLTAAAGLAAALALLPQPTLAEDLPPTDTLQVTASESALERQVHAYLLKRSNLDIENIHYDDERQDMGLVLRDKAHAVQHIVHIDSSASGSNNSERAINIRGYVPLGNNVNRMQLLEFINDYQNSYWAPAQLYIDKDGDLAFQTVVNIPHTTVRVHPEVVYDAYVRTRMALDNHILPAVERFGWQ